MRASRDGHEKKIRLDPAVFTARMSVYLLAGAVRVCGSVTAPSTLMN